MVIDQYEPCFCAGFPQTQSCLYRVPRQGHLIPEVMLTIYMVWARVHGGLVHEITDMQEGRGERALI